MDHHHGHSHGHSHTHSHTGNKNALFSSFCLILTFMVVEVIGGVMTNSLALLSDAGHMLSDAASLGLSFFALKLGERKVSLDKTYGYKRFEIIAAAINGILLVVVAIYIFLEAASAFLLPRRSKVKGCCLFPRSV